MQAWLGGRQWVSRACFGEGLGLSDGTSAWHAQVESLAVSPSVKRNNE